MMEVAFAKDEEEGMVFVELPQQEQLVFANGTGEISKGLHLRLPKKKWRKIFSEQESNGSDHYGIKFSPEECRAIIETLREMWGE